MSRIVTLCLLWVALLVSSASPSVAQPPSRPANSDEPCTRNFRVGGSAAEGYSFRTFEERPGASPSAVLGQAGRSLATMGYAISRIDAQLGIISSSAHAGVLTLNVIVSPVAGETPGTRIEVVAQLRAGSTSPPAAVAREFCQLIASAFGS